MHEPGAAPPAGRITFSKHRVQALSDGIFSIAMTLLVLDLKPPSGVPAGQLWATLVQGASEWRSFVLTFAIAALFWSLQHRVFDALEHFSRHNLHLMFVTLGCVSVLPFATSLMAHAQGGHLPYVLYFANQMAIALSLALQVEVARVQGALHDGPETQSTRERAWWVTLVMLSVVLSAIWLPGEYIWIAPVVLSLSRRAVMGWRKAAARRRVRRAQMFS